MNLKKCHMGKFIVPRVSLMSNITNADYELALKDTNNINIINKLVSKYKKYIPNEELQICMKMALWKALKKYDKTKGRKFTSYLYMVIEW